MLFGYKALNFVCSRLYMIIHAHITVHKLHSDKSMESLIFSTK